MTTVKICGLSTVDQALAAATAGADLIGLVFAPSRRRVTVEQAQNITAALRQQPQGRRVGVVGLFVNEQPDHINAVSIACGLDYIQLSGAETPADGMGIERPVIKAVRLNGTDDDELWLNLLAGQSQPSSSAVPRVVALPTGVLRLAPCPLLIDAHVPGSYGGTGTLANWDAAATLARHQPIMLAGGLTPGNVAAAIARVRPWGVDVSSGVETDGRKDATLIETFICVAKSAA